MIRELATKGASAYFCAAVVETGLGDLVGECASVRDVLETIFALVQRFYRCDYVYRSAIAAKLFLGRHSPTTTTLLPELRVWKSKADLAMFNGTSNAYEIKTELDNLDRLETQLRDYASVFDRTFVVTYQAQADALRAELPHHVGLLVLRGSSLRLAKNAVSNADNVVPRMIVDALRRHEVVEITLRVAGEVPRVSEVALIDACADVLSTCPPRRVHDAMVSVVKSRLRGSREEFDAVPRPLVSAYLESGLRPAKWRTVTERLTQTSIRNLITAHGGNILSVSPGEAV